jgi:hypothetical protein
MLAEYAREIKLKRKMKLLRTYGGELKDLIKMNIDSV